MRRIGDEAAQSSDACVEPGQGVVEGADKGQDLNGHVGFLQSLVELIDVDLRRVGGDAA